MHCGVVRQHLPRPDEGVDHFGVDVGGGGIVEEDVVRRLRLGEKLQLRVVAAAAPDPVGAHLVRRGRGGRRGRRGLLAARRSVAKRRREQGGRAVSGMTTVISGEKPKWAKY